MDHPFIRNIKALIIYIAVWISIAGVHFSFLFFYYAFSVQIALVDSIVFNLTFALLGVTLWYAIKFSVPKKPTLFNYAINHITIFTVVMLLWLGVSINILNIIFANEKPYLVILQSSFFIRIISGLLFYSILALIYYLIIYYLDAQDRMLKETDLREKVREAEICMLRSQINPHFLFNSLNSISSLTLSNPNAAQDMVLQLSDYLRYSVSHQASDMSTLKSELENIKQYLKIEQVRFGSKMQFEFNIPDDCFNYPIPAMILQPLYENAVKHGVYESTEPIVISTTCLKQSNLLLVTITNNYDVNALTRKGAGIGLSNIKERLKLIYRAENLMNISKTETQFIVELWFPIV